MYHGKFSSFYSRFESNWGYYVEENEKSINGLGHGKTNLQERVLVLLERFCTLDTKTDTLSWNPEASWILKKTS